MYEALVARVRYHIQKANFMGLKEAESTLLLAEAADAIEELRKAVNFHKFDSEFWEDKYNSLADEKWIPVTERLPKEGEFVLVYGDLYPNKHDGGVIAVSQRMDWNYWRGFGRERDITHWMPLPEPPKEET